MIKYINLHLSYLCNFNCYYCFLTKQARNSRKNFTRWDDLLTFLKNAPLEDEIVIILVSGELSIRHKLVENAYNQIKKIKRIKDVKISFGIYSNGTDMSFILDLLERGILNPKYVSISWDGVYNSHRCKDKTSIKLINGHILQLGKSRFKDKVLLRSALTTDYLDHIDETLDFINNSGCTNWEYYYLIDNIEYTPCGGIDSDDNAYQFQFSFDKALPKMFTNKIKPYNYILIDRMVKEKWPPLISKKSWCNIGNSIDISIDGKILPCGAFCKQFKYPYPKIKFDDLLDPFNQDKINNIIQIECFDKSDLCIQHTESVKNNEMNYHSYECDSSYCRECPRLIKYKTFDIKNPHSDTIDDFYKTATLCCLHWMEKDVYCKINGLEKGSI